MLGKRSVGRSLDECIFISVVRSLNLLSFPPVSCTYHTFVTLFSFHPLFNVKFYRTRLFLHLSLSLFILHFSRNYRFTSQHFTILHIYSKQFIDFEITTVHVVYSRARSFRTSSQFYWSHDYVNRCFGSIFICISIVSL